ncbi:MAG: peptidylprolyl isomerase [Planctomycetes bacterium]|nr:peptidylprolyl isomerase [Planctomycetota bacterium]MCB9891920.1 peptidylprolyl isomerase [Planctomycetota bacterium]
MNRFVLCAFVLWSSSLPCCRSADVTSTEDPLRLSGGHVDDALRLELERNVDPDAWRPFVTNRDASVRRHAYLAAARIGARFPAELLQDASAREVDPDAFTALVFAWAHRRDDEAFAHLSRWASHEARPIVRAPALRGLAQFAERLRALTPFVIDGLASEDAIVREEAARTAGVVARGASGEALREFTVTVTPLLRTAVSRDLEKGVQVEAARALATWPELTRHSDAALPFLLRLVHEFDTDLRLAAARALAAIDAPSPSVVDALVAAASDGEWRVAAVAVRSLRGKVDPEQRLRLRSELDAATAYGASFHTRVALIDALADDPPTWPILRERLGDVSRSVRVHAFLALAQFDPRSIADVHDDWLNGSDPIQREAAARALAWQDRERASRRLGTALADDHPLVRAAALDVAFQRRAELGGPAEQALRTALREGDLGDVGTVLTAFAGGNGVDVSAWRDDVERAVARFAGFEGIELRALRAQLFGETVPDEGAGFSTIDLSILAKATNPRAVLHTNRGALFVDLDVDSAPVHVCNFLNHAQAGDYDGLAFHRVVSAFVVQGLDPRGDGYGSCSQRLPNEISPVRYELGSLGMPDAGLDSGGCQVFFTQDAVPRLDERYTMFGRVTAGLDVLDRIERGDVCLRVDVYPGG